MHTHPRHELHKDGEFSLIQVPKTPVVLNNPVVSQILQQLDLTLQGVHLLQRKSRNQRSVPARSEGFSTLAPHLARLLTVGVKGNLLGGQLAARVRVITEVDLPERPSPQQLSLSPVDWRPRCCKKTTPDDENPPINN